MLDNRGHVNIKPYFIYTHDFNLKGLFGTRGDDLCCSLNQRSRRHI